MKASNRASIAYTAGRKLTQIFFCQKIKTRPEFIYFGKKVKKNIKKKILVKTDLLKYILIKTNFNSKNTIFTLKYL